MSHGGQNENSQWPLYAGIKKKKTGWPEGGTGTKIRNFQLWISTLGWTSAQALRFQDRGGGGGGEPRCEMRRQAGPGGY